MPADTCSPRGTLGAAGRLNVSAWCLAPVADAREAAAAAAAFFWRAAAPVVAALDAFVSADTALARAAEAAVGAERREKMLPPAAADEETVRGLLGGAEVGLKGGGRDLTRGVGRFAAAAAGPLADDVPVACVDVLEAEDVLRWCAAGAAGRTEEDNEVDEDSA